MMDAVKMLSLLSYVGLCDNILDRACFCFWQLSDNHAEEHIALNADLSWVDLCFKVLCTVQERMSSKFEVHKPQNTTTVVA